MSTPNSTDQSLRRHVIYLLSVGGAHVSFDKAVKAFPATLCGVRPAGLVHTPWMVLEHLRRTQWDILDFSINPDYREMKWPEDYWPTTESPADAEEWNASVEAFRRDLQAMQDLVADPKTDLFAPIPWGDGQTILREALLVADHNSHHVGQLIDLRRMLGAWPVKK